MNKKKWDTLIHNGLLFPELYKPHNIPLKYKNKLIKLSPEAEEYAMLYVKYLKTEHINNENFNKNFWNDWKKIVNEKKNKISSFSDCDFSKYEEIYYKNKNNNNNKIFDEKEEDKYRYALVDGRKEEVGNFKIEPPGIFIGRGDNPNIGKIKKRIYPSDVTINISDKNKIDNIGWKNIINDNTVEWIASWKDDITQKTKYVWLSQSSEFKTQNDINKFDLAKMLKKKMPLIKYINNSLLISEKKKEKQIATALFFIDKLSLRVGGEKSEDDTDTVGVTTLRVEHLKISKDNILELDFLGKDSIPYKNKILVDDIIGDNIRSFIDNKNNKEQVFNLVKYSDMNSYLQNLMTGLTAKVFRSYNASNLFQKELNKIIKHNDLDVKKKSNKEIIEEYNIANGKVAKLLNHQKKIKNDGKNNISITTSKENYIDPRISVTFAKKINIPISKIFTKKQLSKFNWALTYNDYVF